MLTVYYYIYYEICLFTLGYIVFLDQNILKQIYFTFHIVNISVIFLCMENPS